MIRNKPRAAVYGVDLGKNLFHVVGTNAAGEEIQRAKFRRETVLTFFERADPAIVGMEACPGSQWFARKLTEYEQRKIADKIIEHLALSNYRIEQGPRGSGMARAWCLAHRKASAATS